MSDLPQPLARALLSLSPLGRQQRLSILIFHRVFKERDWMRPGEPTEAEFAWQMRLLQRHFTVLPLPEAVQLLKENRLPPRAACVTFDDGYADNATVALPVLQQYGIPATVFVAAGYLNGGSMWNDTVVESLRHYKGDELDLSELEMPVYRTGTDELRRKTAYAIISQCKYLETNRRKEVADHIAQHTEASLPDDLMLTTEQLLTLHQQGVEIGGHTFSHPILSSLPPDDAKEEIVGGKVALESIINGPVRVFAYPNGRPNVDYNETHVAFVKQAGFEAAVATNWGVSDRNSDFLQLPRFTPWDKTSTRFLLRMALNSRHVSKTPGEDKC